MRDVQYKNVQEISQYYRVKPLTIYKWVQHSQMPHLRIGRHLRFDPEKVQAWLEARQAFNLAKKENKGGNGNG